MSFSVVKSLLVALVAGASVQAGIITQSSGVSASSSAQFHTSGFSGSSINIGSAFSFIQSQSSNIFSNYHVDVQDFSNLFYQAVNSASSSQVIDLSSFSTLFGSNLDVCVPEIEKLIKEYLLKAGIKKTVTFQVPTVKVKTVSDESALLRQLFSEVYNTVQVLPSYNVATIQNKFNIIKSNYRGCNICLKEANKFENNLFSLVQTSQPRSTILSQFGGFYQSQQQQLFSSQSSSYSSGSISI